MQNHNSLIHKNFSFLVLTNSILFQTGFYKGRVLEKLSLPHQSSPEWVNGTPVHVNGGVTNGHCTDCDTTEQQLKMGAVNTVRDHETRLTNALKVRGIEWCFERNRVVV